MGSRKVRVKGDKAKYKTFSDYSSTGRVSNT